MRIFPGPPDSSSGAIPGASPAALLNDAFTVRGRVDVQAMKGVLVRLLRLAWRYPALFISALLCAAGGAFANLAAPALLGQAVDRAHRWLAAGHPAGSDGLGPVALLIVLACALRGSFAGLQGYLGESLAQRVGRDLRLAFHAHLQRLDFGFHDRRHTGDLIARGMLDIEGVRAFLESGVLRTVSLGLLVFAGAWRLMHVDLVLGALALGFVPFVAWRAARMGLLLRLSWERLQQLMADLTRGMEENLQGVRVVRAFATQAFELAKFDALSGAALALSIRRIGLRMGSVTAMNLAYYLAMGLVLWFGSTRIAAGLLSVGQLAECLTFMALLQQPVRQVGMIVNASARASSSGARLFEVLDTEPAVQDAPGALPLALTGGVLRFEHVHFSYPGRPDHAALTDVSFELRRGRVLGIVGAPGSGKSTIAQLAARFYDVSAGRITIDGQDIRGLTLESLRRAVGVVQQDTFLFDVSVFDNAAYVEPGAEARRVHGVVGTAQFHDHVAGLPDGYSSRVGERGSALSGGQRQRLALARGLLTAPPIVVLDDATSAVDANTERSLRSALREALGDAAVMVITHRLAGVAHADEILVLDAGRVVERGSHAQLLARGGSYARLWALQQGQAHAGRTEAAVESGL